MGKDAASLSEQAQRLRETMPELYEFLLEKDRAVENAFRLLAAAIPDPDLVPDISIPFDGLVKELLKPGSEDKCKHWLEDDPDAILPLPLEFRERMYRICRSGVYIRTARLSSILDG